MILLGFYSEDWISLILLLRFLYWFSVRWVGSAPFSTEMELEKKEVRRNYLPETNNIAPETPGLVQMSFLLEPGPPGQVRRLLVLGV